MVEAMAKNGMIAFFGSGGLSLSEVEEAIIRLKKALPPLKRDIDCPDQSSQSPQSSQSSQYSRSSPSSEFSLSTSSFFSNAWGCNFIHSHGDPELEMALAQLYLKYGVQTISAAAFMRITLALVYYRLKGIHRNMEGDIITPNKIIAKVSRVEVARQFFSPPPEKLVTELLDQGLISQDEAELAPYIPMAQDLTAEADSGGHTDNRPAISLWPTMAALKDEFNKRFNYAQPLCVGFAGGIATPESAAAAFQMGAAYILTGSINQSCVEAGTSQSVKSLLAQAEQADVAMAPAADMFEIGAKVQVLKRGTMFSVRAEKLYQVYKTYDCFEAVPDKLKTEIEEKYLQASFSQKWEETKEFFRTRTSAGQQQTTNSKNIKELEQAHSDPRYKMALVFRSYLGLSSRWSISGDPQRKMDYQIWCGPSMGAFNQWVKGSFLEKSENRKVADIAINLLLGASVCTRAGWLRSQGVELPVDAGSFRPLGISQLTRIISHQDECE
ncbi:MAG: PfaD family polyunsaturated fatty acid/polyketide biosynthesis protein [Desulfamplus sp.]|nr:PfaD family polyunsaturated fatty acid/polyketide biosynthesis protein [Desulfamplus sp.]